MIGFDIARTSNPRANLGVAQAMVNMGGFSATLFVLAVMGAVMTALGGFTPEAFRLAWLVQYPVWLVAVIGVLVLRRQSRGQDVARTRPVAKLREPEQPVRSVPEHLGPVGRLRDEALRLAEADAEAFGNRAATGIAAAQRIEDQLPLGVIE